MPRDLQILAKPDPLGGARLRLSLPAGASVAEIVERVQPDRSLWGCAHVRIDDWAIDRAYWHRARPKEGRRVVVTFYPSGGDGGGKQVVRLALLVAVSIAAPYAGFAAGTALGATEGASLAAYYAGAIGFTLAATAAINALIPLPQAKLPKPDTISPTYSLGANSNRLTPDGVVPQLLGRHRIYPPYASRPYTEQVGEDQYLRVAFDLTVGKCTIEDGTIQLGETSIDNYKGVQIEFSEEVTGGTGITLFPKEVIEEQPGIKLLGPATPYTHTTQLQTDEVTIDLAAPGGLLRIDKSGDKFAISVLINVQYKLAADPDVSGSWTYEPIVSLSAKSSSVIRKGVRIVFPTRDQYDVRLTRQTDDLDANNGSDQVYSDDVVVMAFRSIRNDPPWTTDGVSRMAMRILATDQINGILQDLNMIAQTVAPSWDGTDWTETETSNPADLARNVLCGNGNKRALDPSRLNDQDYQDWHDWCVTNGKTFNMYRDFQASIWYTLLDVCAAGRAKPNQVDGLWTITRDIPQTAPVDLFTPRNSWGLKGVKTFYDRPHGLRVPFINEREGWLQDERIVYDDGYSVDNATLLERIELPGVTNPDQIYADARYRIADGKLRPETISFSIDVENLAHIPGDLIHYQNEVLLVGLGCGRVSSAAYDDTGHLASITLDRPVTMEAVKDYGIRVRSSEMWSTRYQVASIEGEASTLTLTTVTTDAVEPGDVWAFGEYGVETIPLIIRTIRPGPNLSAEISCVAEAPGVHTADTEEIPPFDSYVTTPPGAFVPSILSVRSDEYVMLRNTDGTLKPRILVAFAFLSQRYQYEVAGVQARIRSAIGDDTWHSLPQQPPDVREISFEEVEEGLVFDMRFRYVFRNGTVGEWADVLGHRVVGKTSPPPNVDRFYVRRLPDGTREFTWATDTLPPDFYGSVIRYAAGFGGPLWDNMTPLHTGVLLASPFETNQLAKGDWTIAIKNVDTSGNLSTNALYVEVTLADPRLQNAVAWGDEYADGWPGTLVNCFKTGVGTLEAKGSGTINSLPSAITSLSGSIRTMVGNQNPIEYITSGIDLDAVVVCTPQITTAGNGAEVQYMRTASTLVGLSSASWVPVAPVTTQFIQLRVTRSVANPATDGASFTAFSYIIDGQIKTETFEDIAVGSTAASVWFERISAGHFIVAPKSSGIGTIQQARITALQNVGGGWSWDLVSKHSSLPSNPTIYGAEFRTYNASNALQNCTVDVELKGPTGG